MDGFLNECTSFRDNGVLKVKVHSTPSTKQSLDFINIKHIGGMRGQGEYISHFQCVQVHKYSTIDIISLLSRFSEILSDSGACMAEINLKNSYYAITKTVRMTSSHFSASVCSDFSPQEERASYSALQVGATFFPPFFAQSFSTLCAVSRMSLFVSKPFVSTVSSASRAPTKIEHSSSVVTFKAMDARTF